MQWTHITRIHGHLKTPWWDSSWNPQRWAQPPFPLSRPHGAIFCFFTLPWSCQDWELCHFLNKHHGSDFGASLEVKSTKPVNLFRRPSFGYSKFEVFLVRSQRFVWVDCATECLHDLSTSACQSPKTFSRTSNADQHLILKEQFLSIYLSIIYLTSTSHSSPGNDLFQGRIATKHTQNRLTSALEKSVTCTW